MDYADPRSTSVLAWTRDRLTLGLLALACFSIPLVLAVGSAAAEPEASPIYYLTIGLLAAFGWRVRFVLLRAGMGYYKANFVTSLVLLALAVALIAAVVGGWLVWGAVA